MLILSRCPDEDIVVNDNLIIKVLSIKGKQVKLGFTGPTKDYLILRKEVHERIKDSEKSQTAKS